MGILDEINSLVKSAAAMPPQNPVVPGIGAPPQVGRTVPPIAPPEVKTPAPPVPPQHKSELPKAMDDRKAWFRMAADQIRAQRMNSERLEREDPYKMLDRTLRRSTVDRLKGLNRGLAN